jgi:hypothetical protein
MLQQESARKKYELQQVDSRHYPVLSQAEFADLVMEMLFVRAG